MIRRLRLKFICINMTIVTLMRCVLFAVTLRSTRASLERDSVQMLRSISMESLRFPHGRPDRQNEGVQLPFFILDVGSNGELLAAEGGYYDLSDEEFLRELIQMTAGQEPIGVLPQYGLRYCRTELRGFQRLVFADMSSEINTMRHLLRNCLLIGTAGFLAFLVISLLLARWAVKPVEQAWDRQRQFVADASHELKPPLPVILPNAELLQSPAQDPARRRQFADNILTMARQMRGLVESLLDLARLDSGRTGEAPAQTDLSRLVSDALLPFEPLYFEAGLTLDSRIEEGITLRGNPAHLRQVVEVLLDNAQKYSSSPGVVQVSLKRRGRNHCLLSVSNPGSPLSPEEQKEIFKRFYRADRVRSMNHSYGLGLAIAERIVQEHHGKIWAESTAQGNTFHVQLPT